MNFGIFLKKKIFFSFFENVHSIFNIALIKKIKALSFLQFFLKFHKMASKWHFKQDLDEIWHDCEKKKIFFFEAYVTKVSQRKKS